MPHGLDNVLARLFGSTGSSLSVWNMTARSAVTFILTIAMLRWGHKRLFSESTAYDMVGAIMVGSVMSRAITGSGGGSMVAIWIAGFVLIALHRLFSWLSYRITGFGPLVKGSAMQIIRDGQPLPGAMRKTTTTADDLSRAIREAGYDPATVHIRQAYLERDGGISIVAPPRVLEVHVENGVQTIRIEV